MGHAWKVVGEAHERLFADDWTVRNLTVEEMMRRHGFASKDGVAKTVRRLGLPPRPGGRPRGTGRDIGGRWVLRGLTRVWVDDDEEAA